MTLFVPLLIASFFYVADPFVTMREFPSKTADVCSQSYYSEPVSVLEETSGWLKIETQSDHYSGWIENDGNLCKCDVPFQPDIRVNRLQAHLYSEEDTVKGPALSLPYDSRLKLLDDSNPRWLKVLTVDGMVRYIQRGDVDLHPTLLGREEMCSLSLRFLGLPYYWGGRSSLGGFDCSGFVQMLYRQMGVAIPRNSRDQVRWEGFSPVAIDQLTPGDTIYFGLAEDQIRHVGLFLGNGQFIHATVAENAPYIHISRLSDPEWSGQGKWKYVTGRTLKAGFALNRNEIKK